MLPTKRSIRQALEASEEALFLTQNKAKGYEDPISSIRERQKAINHVRKTGTPYLDILRQYRSQAGFIELWEFKQQEKK